MVTTPQAAPVYGLVPLTLPGEAQAPAPPENATQAIDEDQPVATEPEVNQEEAAVETPVQPVSITTPTATNNTTYQRTNRTYRFRFFRR